MNDLAIQHNSIPPQQMPYCLSPTGGDGQGKDFDMARLPDRPDFRPNLTLVMISNVLSLVGSLIIILHIPRVTHRVPTQTKRMLIILFTAISNFGFALSNVATGNMSMALTSGEEVFFQLLTCMLVIVGTFRLCGVFLFQSRRSVPSRYILLCPLFAFILATTPAIAGQYGFDDCGNYCWFKVNPNAIDCKVRSLWAWLCFYAWMILFLATLFASTLFVMAKIAISVIISRKDLKRVAHQTLQDSITSSNSGQEPSYSNAMTNHSITNDALTVNGRSLSQGEQSPRTPSTFQHLRSMSATIQSRTARILSFGRSNPPHQEQEPGTHLVPVTPPTVVCSTPSEPPLEPIESAPISRSLDIPALRREVLPMPERTFSSSSIISSSVAVNSPQLTSSVSATTTAAAVATAAATGSHSLEANMSRGNTLDISDTPAVLRAKERSFVIAIFRQSLYPISISVSGCIQIFADLTLTINPDYINVLDYTATVATSIQGFLFFMVFMFDPAVLQTRRHWRKYIAWRYYVEFYFGMGMVAEGKEFTARFLEQVQRLEPKEYERIDPAVLDRFLRPPSYSWFMQYFDEQVTRPSEFQTSYPLELCNIAPTLPIPLPIPSGTGTHGPRGSIASQQQRRRKESGSRSAVLSGGGESSRGSARSGSAPVMEPGSTHGPGQGSPLTKEIIMEDLDESVHEPAIPQRSMTGIKNGRGSVSFVTPAPRQGDQLSNVQYNGNGNGNFDKRRSSTGMDYTLASQHPFSLNDGRSESRRGSHPRDELSIPKDSFKHGEARIHPMSRTDIPNENTTLDYQRGSISRSYTSVTTIIPRHHLSQGSDESPALLTFPLTRLSLTPPLRSPSPSSPRRLSASTTESAALASSPRNVFEDDRDELYLNDDLDVDLDEDLDEFEPTPMSHRHRRQPRRISHGSRHGVKGPGSGSGSDMMFPRLTRVTTIGGGDYLSGRARTNGSGGWGSGSSRAHHSGTFHSNIGRGRTGIRGSRSSSGSSSLERVASVLWQWTERLRILLLGEIRWRSGTTVVSGAAAAAAVDAGGNPDLERYMAPFRWPRLAYVIHIIVRWVYVPKAARLPPIPRPPFGSQVIAERWQSIDLLQVGSPCDGHCAMGDGNGGCQAFNLSEASNERLQSGSSPVRHETGIENRDSREGRQKESRNAHGGSEAAGSATIDETPSGILTETGAQYYMVSGSKCQAEQMV
ncbi:hypothetical protein BGW38_002319 [Lunasporangiospora selenospora]|uniref:G-protein coupled receptors family 2 profile 2 domain-containing protein n=1 Tax=Lunasporangiospora selenospora TaxID=979761 RepID=A0A9P6G359_9FUNG|nr:hypothetical protein BGW38_002319 [Lunasporangiospora selenospora]